MAKLSKRFKAIIEKITPDKTYAADEAFKFLKENSAVKFNESVDVAVNLGIDPRKSDQNVRGATSLPHGTGKEVRIAVFAQGANAKAAEEAGADVVGFEDLAERIQKGDLNFDVIISTPDGMRVVGKLGALLGPRGLMPNPKVGTVTADVADAVKKAKAGQVRYRADKGGIVHCSIGKVVFSENNLLENLRAVLLDLKKAKPSTSKGVYFKKITLSTTMGPGMVVDPTSVGV